MAQCGNCSKTQKRIQQLPADGDTHTLLVVLCDGCVQGNKTIANLQYTQFKLKK